MEGGRRWIVYFQWRIDCILALFLSDNRERANFTEEVGGTWLLVNTNARQGCSSKTRTQRTHRTHTHVELDSNSLNLGMNLEVDEYPFFIAKRMYFFLNENCKAYVALYEDLYGQLPYYIFVLLYKTGKLVGFIRGQPNGTAPPPLASWSSFEHWNS